MALALPAPRITHGEDGYSGMQPPQRAPELPPQGSLSRHGKWPWSSSFLGAAALPLMKPNHHCKSIFES